MSRIGGALLLIGAGSAVGLGWWNGYFASLAEDVVVRIRARQKNLGAVPKGQ